MARAVRVVRLRDAKGRFRKGGPYVIQYTPTDCLIISTNTISSFRFMDLTSELRYVASRSFSQPVQTANSLPERPSPSL